MTKIFNRVVCTLICAALLFSACKPEKIDDYTVPATYNFENVSYSGQTQRLNMLGELEIYMDQSGTVGTALDADKLKAMYSNDSANAGWQGTYEDSKQLKSKTFEAEQAVFDDLLERLAKASQSAVAGSEGVAGVVESKSGEKAYLLDENGLDLVQMIEKGLMGACFYYQATTVYFGSGKMDVDNETVTEGKGTEMEHHWDEAFGYLGVPIDFPANTDGIRYWGKYANSRDGVLGSNQELMDALLKGRAAISNDDLEARDEAIAEARDAWEMVSVGTALHYINAGIENFDDIAIRAHALSEAAGFIYSLKFNETKRITNSEIDELNTLVGGAADFASMNLYNADTAKLQQAKDKLAQYYGVEDKKDEF